MSRYRNINVASTPMISSLFSSRCPRKPPPTVNCADMVMYVSSTHRKTGTACLPAASEKLLRATSTS